MESMWGAMKETHYRRTTQLLEKSIRDAGNLEAAMTGALNTVVEAIHAVAGTLWYYDRFGDGRVRPKAVYGGDSLKGVSLMLGEGIAGQVIEKGESVIIQDCQKDPRWAGKVDAKTGFKTQTMICVPLKLQKVTFGSIQIINKTDGVSFDDTDLAFAQQLADTAAEMFRRQGLLDDYITEQAGGDRTREVTFMQVFGAADDQELRHQLYRLESFAGLRASEQQEVLKLCQSLYTYFGGKKRRRFFG